jgi:L-amino acid N-acyltransferase YncA
MAGPLIRLATADDAAAIAAIYAPYVTDTPVSFEEVAPDAAEMARRIAGDDRGLHPWLVAEEGGAVIGYASSSAFRTRPAYRWTVETGVYLPPEAQGRGLGRALMERMLALLEKQGFTSVVAGITLPNAASVALHEKLGFAACATYRDTGFKMGDWRTVQVYSRDLAPRLNPPAELVLTPFAPERNQAATGSPLRSGMSTSPPASPLLSKARV